MKKKKFSLESGDPQESLETHLAKSLYVTQSLPGERFCLSFEKIQDDRISALAVRLTELNTNGSQLATD